MKMASSLAQSAIMDFCVATRELKRIASGSAQQRREMRESVTMCKDLLHRELGALNVECIPVKLEDETVYVRLVKRKRSVGKITASRMVDALGDQDERTLVKLLGLSGGGAGKDRTLDDAFVDVLTQLMLPTTTESVEISKVAPRGFVPTATHVNVNVPTLRDGLNASSRITEVAAVMARESEAISSLRKKDTLARQPFEKTRKSAEPNVSTHLKDYDPVHLTQQVKLQQGGKEWTYYLRQREKTSSPPLTLKNAIRIFRTELSLLRARNRISNTLTIQEALRIRHPEFLSALQRCIQLAIEKAEEDRRKTVATVTMGEFNRIELRK